MNDRTHLPRNENRRPHVPVETITIGELFHMYERGEVGQTSQQDQDYLSLQRSERRRRKKAEEIGPRP